MNLRYRVDLSHAERDELQALVSRGKLPARRLKRMQILRAADAGVADDAIAASVQTSDSTSARQRARAGGRLRIGDLGGPDERLLCADKPHLA
jgi:hypothetical protein